MIQLRETNISKDCARSPHFTIEYVEFLFTTTHNMYFFAIKIKVTRDKYVFI